MDGLRRTAAVALIVALGAGWAGCAGREADDRATPVPVVVDTDMGADDILALLYLLGRDDVNVVAVTVVGDGIVRCPKGADNARAVLAAAGRTDIPVAYGGIRPMAAAGAAFPDQWRDQADGLYGMADHWSAPDGEPAADAAALMAGKIRERRATRILALGPLTTVATVLRQPGVADAAPRVIVSGGAVNEPGNMPRDGGPSVAEWNIGADPDAAQAVLRSGHTDLWVTLDASNEVPADPWFVSALAGIDRGVAGEAAMSFLRANPGLSRGGFFYWDPLAAVTVTDLTVVTTRAARLAVRTDPSESGRTVEEPTGTPTTVTTKANPIRFAEAMLTAYGRPGDSGPAYRPGVPAIQVTRELGAFRMDAPALLPAGDTTIGFDATSGGGYVVVIGQLAAGRTYADVERAVAAGVTTPPPWFTVVAVVDVPAGSRPTWLVDLPVGSFAAVAAHANGSELTALGSLTVR